MELVKTLLIKNLANQIMCLQRHLFLYPPAERDMRSGDENAERKEGHLSLNS